MRREKGIIIDHREVFSDKGSKLGRSLTGMLTGPSENYFRNKYNRGDEEDYIRKKHTSGSWL
jgi:hypothetical protein